MILATAASGARLGVMAARVNIVKALQEQGLQESIIPLCSSDLSVSGYKRLLLIVTAEASLWTLLLRGMFTV